MPDTITSDPGTGDKKYSFNNGFITEDGINYREKFIAWDEIDTLYIITQIKKTTMNVGNAGPAITVESNLYTCIKIKTPRGVSINLEFKEYYSPYFEKSKYLSEKIYEFIVSKITDRQMEKLVSALKEGAKVNFGAFDITEEGLELHRHFGLRRKIPSSCIVSFKLNNGYIELFYLNKSITDKSDISKSNIRTVTLAEINKVPNFHIAYKYLQSAAIFLDNKDGKLTINPVLNSYNLFS